MDTMTSALYGLAQQQGATPEQLERYCARLRLANLAWTRPPCPHCFVADGHGGRLERAEGADAINCSRCGETFCTQLDRRAWPGGHPCVAQLELGY